MYLLLGAKGTYLEVPIYRVYLPRGTQSPAVQSRKRAGALWRHR